MEFLLFQKNVGLLKVVKKIGNYLLCNSESYSCNYRIILLASGECEITDFDLTVLVL